MCYNLMKEEILVRLRELKADLIERYFSYCQSKKLWELFQFDICCDLKGCKMSADVCAVNFKGSPTLPCSRPPRYGYSNGSIWSPCTYLLRWNRA